MKDAKNESKEQYFYEYTKMYLVHGEDINNISNLKKEYADAYVKRKEQIDNLYDEIKKIKKLRV